jgi:hypothetical protein
VVYLKMIARLQDAGAAPSQQDEIAQYRASNVEALPIVKGIAAMQYLCSNQLVAAWTAAGEGRRFKHDAAPRERRQARARTIRSRRSSFRSARAASIRKKPAMFVDLITNHIDANKILLGEPYRFSDEHSRFGSPPGITPASLHLATPVARASPPASTRSPS